jgi:hypothetical protein
LLKPLLLERFKQEPLRLMPSTSWSLVGAEAAISNLAQAALVAIVLLCKARHLEAALLLSLH